MLLDPFSHESKRSIGKGSCQHRTRRYLDLGRFSAVAGVEMRRRMVAEVHLDHNAEEAADSGHRLSFAGQQDGRADNSILPQRPQNLVQKLVPDSTELRRVSLALLGRLFG